MCLMENRVGAVEKPEVPTQQSPGPHTHGKFLTEDEFASGSTASDPTLVIPAPVPEDSGMQLPLQGRGSVSATPEEVSGRTPAYSGVFSGHPPSVSLTLSVQSAHRTVTGGRPPWRTGKDPLSVLSLLFCGT